MQQRKKDWKEVTKMLTMLPFSGTYRMAYSFFPLCFWLVYELPVMSITSFVKRNKIFWQLGYGNIKIGRFLDHKCRTSCIDYTWIPPEKTWSGGFLRVQKPLDLSQPCLAGKQHQSSCQKQAHHLLHGTQHLLVLKKYVCDPPNTP